MVEELYRTAFGNRWDEAAANRLRVEVDRADRMGMRASVFAKSGDSNLAAYNALYGLGCRDPEWSGFEWLEPTMRRYRETGLPSGHGPADQVSPPADRTPWNSFSRRSAAAYCGIIGDYLIEPSSRFADEPGWQPDPECGPDESVLECEIRLTRPRFVFINLGTNGSSYGMNGRETAEEVGELIDEIRRLGPVPIPMTIPVQLDGHGKKGRWDFAKDASEWMVKIAAEKGSPIFDQWSMLADRRMINHGMIDFDGKIYDGFHLETIGGFRSADALQRGVDFSPEALLYGTNMRNLLMLRTLHTLDSALMPSSE
ncbi:MAG: SGNH/GDSL hydrolase family protein [Solirubrobacterales bacterium]